MKTLIATILFLVLVTSALAKNENKHQKQKSLPPGLQKKYQKTGQLPPGWQTKIIQGEVLEPGLYDLSKKYPVNPGEYSLEPKVGTEVIRIEDRIIRIKKDTKEILEVLGVQTTL